LDVWPTLPLVVYGIPDFYNDESLGMDNIIAALGQSDRVCQVDLCLPGGGEGSEEALAAMQVPFPELTQMRISSDDDSETAAGIPDSFMGGSAPRLRTITLESIPFLGFPKFLLSATHLVELCLHDIPHSGYILPEAMVALLSASSNLETLLLNFRSPEYRPVSGSRSLPPIKRSILPALRKFNFEGVTEYLEELVTHIDTPRLDAMGIGTFNQIGTPRLAQFINSTSLRAGDGAVVEFFGVKIQSWVKALNLLILCPESDRQLSSVAQVYNPLHLLSTVECLYIRRQSSKLVWMNDAIETLWLQLLLPFTAVKNLYLSKAFAPSIAAALKELVGGRIIEVLPNLQNIFVEGLQPSGPLQENFGQFIAARELSDRPVAHSIWDKDSSMKPV
jgi:hypothetical protein